MAGSRDTNAFQEVTRSDAVVRWPGACRARVNTPSNVWRREGVQTVFHGQ